MFYLELVVKFSAVGFRTEKCPVPLKGQLRNHEGSYSLLFHLFIRLNNSSFRINFMVPWILNAPKALLGTLYNKKKCPVLRFYTEASPKGRTKTLYCLTVHKCTLLNDFFKAPRINFGSQLC